MSNEPNSRLIAREVMAKDVEMAKLCVNVNAKYGAQIATPNGYDNERFLRFCEGLESDCKLRVIVGEVDGRSVGIIWFHAYDQSPAATFALCILDGRQNQGFGKELLSQAIQLYKALAPDIRYIETFVGHTNIRSIRGLWSNGFRLNSCVEGAYKRDDAAPQDRLEFILELRRNTRITNYHDVDGFVDPEREINRLVTQVSNLWPIDRSLIVKSTDTSLDENKTFSNVLDLGGGSGHFSSKLAELFKLETVTVIDSSQRLVELGRMAFPEFRFQVTDMLSGMKSLAANSVDLVISRLVMQHCEEDYVNAVLKEAYRVLRGNGLILILGSDPSSFNMFPSSPAFNLMKEMRGFRRRSQSIVHDQPSRISVSLAGAGFRHVNLTTELLTSEKLGKSVFAKHFSTAVELGVGNAWKSLDEEVQVQISAWEKKSSAYAQAIMYAARGVKL